MNNASPSKHIAMMPTTREVEMATYDALPSAIRAAVRELPVPLRSAP